MKTNNLFAVGIALILAGCTHIKAERYEAKHEMKDGKLVRSMEKAGNGFEAFRAEPYILVKHIQGKEKKLEVDLIYLPNYDQMTVIKQVPGIGTSQLNLTYNGPMLTSVGAIQDSQTDELASAILSPLATVASAGLTAGGSVAAAGLTGLSEIVKTAIGMTGDADAAGEGGDACGPLPVADWVQKVRANIDLGTMSLEHSEARKAAIWSYLNEVRRLSNAGSSVVDDSIVTSLCNNTSSLMASLEKLDLEDRAAVSTLLSGVETVDVQSQVFPNKKEIRKSVESIRTILLSYLYKEMSPEHPFELYKINSDGTLTMVAAR